MQYTWARLLSWLARHPVVTWWQVLSLVGHSQVACLIPTWGAYGKQPMDVSLSLSPPPSSLSKINKTHPQVGFTKMRHTTGFKVHSMASVFTHEHASKKLHLQKLKMQSHFYNFLHYKKIQFHRKMWSYHKYYFHNKVHIQPDKTLILLYCCTSVFHVSSTQRN